MIHLGIPVMAYMGELCLKWYLFFLGLRYIKAEGFTSLDTSKARNLLFTYFKGPLITFIQIDTIWLQYVVLFHLYNMEMSRRLPFWGIIYNMKQI